MDKIKKAGFEIIDIIDKYNLSQRESCIVLDRVKDSIISIN